MNVQGKKSWFTLDGQIIALGAGITGDTTASIETIVDNRLLNDSYTYQVLSDTGMIDQSQQTKGDILVIVRIRSSTCVDRLLFPTKRNRGCNQRDTHWYFIEKSMKHFLVIHIQVTTAPSQSIMDSNQKMQNMLM